MKSKEIEVVKLLLENRGKELSINQIAKLLKKDYKNAHNLVNRLLKMSAILIQPFGNSHKITLIDKMRPLIFEAEFIRRNEILKNRDIAVMCNSFTQLSSKLHVVLLFGSYAKKMQTKHSDIDLLFIVPNEADDKIEREIQENINLLPLNIHLNIFKEKEFRAMKNSKEITVGSEAIKNNIVLYGIEPYYEMIK